MITKVKLLIIGLLAVTILFSGCSVSTSTNGEERESRIILERYGMFTLPEFQFQRVTITPNQITFETFGPEMNRTGMTNNSLSNETYRELEEYFLGFSKLDSSYSSDIPIADIGAGNITYITQNGSYSVIVDPWVSRGNPEEIGIIVDVLNEFIASNVQFPSREGNESGNQESETKGDNESRGDLFSMEYHGKACIEEPWEEWYSQGNINYVQAPTQTQLIIDYYANSGLELQNLEEISSGPTCKACEICADSTYFQAEVTASTYDILQEEGWEISQETSE